MSKIQVSAKMKINHGMLEEFKQQAAKCISIAKEKDPGTLQYDWFISRLVMNQKQNQKQKQEGIMVTMPL